MTSISDRCKTAREKATPGPWEAKEDYATENENGDFSLEEWVEADGQYLFGNANSRVLLDHPGNLPLAALAPEAADEVIRLTAALEDLAEWFDIQVMRGSDLDSKETLLAAAAQAMIWKILNQNEDTND